MLILTFLVFSDSRSSVLSTNFLKDGLFKGSWFQQDCIMLYLQKKDWDEFQLLKKTLLFHTPHFTTVQIQQKQLQLKLCPLCTIETI